MALFQVNFERVFFNNLKQGLQIMYGNTRRFSELTIEQQSDLWKSVEKGLFSKFKMVADYLVSLGNLRAIPVRLLLPNGVVKQKSIKIDIDPLKSLKTVLQDDFRIETSEVMVQGISIDTHTSVRDIWWEMRHPDTFLYVSIPNST